MKQLLNKTRMTSRIVFAGGISLGIIFIVTSFISIYQIRRDTEKEWSTQLERTTLVVSEQASQTFFSATTALNSISDIVNFARLRDEKSYRHFASQEKQYLFLKEKKTSNPIIDVATFIADNGDVLNFTRSYPPPKINLADRDYFKALKANNSDEIFYSVPVKNKGNSKWVFYLAKRINGAQGQFLGIVLIGVSAENFSAFYEKVGSNLGSGASISLYRNDYILMTRWPFVDKLVGIKNSNSATQEIIGDRTTVEHGLLITDKARFSTGTASEPRMVAARVVNEFPFIATVVIPKSLYAPNFFSHVGWILGLLTIGLILLFTFVRHVLFANSQINLELLERGLVQKALGDANEKLETLAYIDLLTGLPNRQNLIEQLNLAIDKCKITPSHYAILFIDLDNFKELNDRYGHDRGDLLLTKVAKQLLACVGSDDIVSRFGGDEFVILLSHLEYKEIDGTYTAELISQKILNTLTQTKHLDGIEYRCSASIGITIFGQEPLSEFEIIKRADIAMYHAKMSGRNTFSIFNAQLQKDFEYKLHLGELLKDAIEQNHFEYYYQPQFDNHLNIIGAELLLRWKTIEGDEILPNIFIPLAEQNGLMIKLGNLVIENAATQIAAWSTFPFLSNLTLAINISSQQIEDTNFVHSLITCLNSHQVKASQLRLELTESVLITKFEDAIRTLDLLKSYGIKLSLDDFGTGYSSLSYLRRLPIDELKIDQSFVRGIVEGSSACNLIITIINLAKILNINVIAEGVETKEERDFLFENGCFLYQGFLYSKPLPLNEFIEFVRSWKHIDPE